MDGWTNGWTMFLPYTDAIEASEKDDFLTYFLLFAKALQTEQPTDQKTNQQTNGPMDQWTNQPTKRLIASRAHD